MNYQVVECYQGHRLYTQPRKFQTLAEAADALRAQVADGRVHRDLAIICGLSFVPRSEWSAK